MLDLFGEVVVTSEDLERWVSALAPGFSLSEHRMAYYILHWNVADKVRRAKLAGTFDATIENARSQRAYLTRRLGITSA
ncbi:hypothetical protein E2553_43190 [Paraburkholderia dipogonis]|uniref:Uncharacterized protein n=2 Tax=Paraburkholderia dipogonis TaxID=1211383 RepID=A0A4Y8MHU5_9BURK|nr:hypothetical protein E2553_43190 [Paraburkholderia dipogonis]